MQLSIITYSTIHDKPSDELFAQLMEDIPLLPALKFIVERQDSFIFAFSDIEGQKNAIYEMRCYLNADEQRKVDEFICVQQNPVLFMNLSCLSFYAQALRKPNTEYRALTNDEKRRVFLSYLICNENWSSHQEDGFVVDNEHPENMLLKVDMPLSEFKRHKDFKAAIYKATQLFKFCETHSDYKKIADKFQEEHHVTDWRLYLSNLFDLYAHSLNIEDSQLSPETLAFSEQYAFSLSELQDDDAVDLNWLREHFIVKESDGNILILNNNLIVDKMYQGLKFDLFKTAHNHNLTINGMELPSVGKLNELLGQDFSEEYLLYDLLEKIYSDKKCICYRGKDLYGKIEAEPDYYLRQDNKMLLFEHKDVLIGETSKQETDVNTIVEAIADKVCREKSKKKGRKGGPQLLFTMDGIFLQDSMQSFDVGANAVDLVYPVVTVVDSSFSALGVARATVNRFCELSQNYETIKQRKTHVVPLTIIDIDTLFILSKRLHDGVLDIFSLIGEYQNILCKKDVDIFNQPSFSSFIADYYPLYEITQDDNAFLLSNFYAELAKLG